MSDSIKIHDLNLLGAQTKSLVVWEAVRVRQCLELFGIVKHYGIMVSTFKFVIR